MLHARKRRYENLADLTFFFQADTPDEVFRTSQQIPWHSSRISDKVLNITCSCASSSDGRTVHWLPLSDEPLGWLDTRNVNVRAWRGTSFSLQIRGSVESFLQHSSIFRVRSYLFLEKSTLCCIGETIEITLASSLSRCTFVHSRGTTP